MKKTLIALAALSAIAGTAQAQSTVTLYGLVDAYVGRVTSNGATLVSGSQTVQGIDALNGNRWGLKGSEDLGGGLSAIFNLESGFKIDDGTSGQNGQLFGRRSNVGLKGEFGTVELGRSSGSYNDVAYISAMMGGGTTFDPSNLNNSKSANTAALLASTVAGASPYLGRTQTWLGFQERVNNSIKYTSPVFSGVTASLTYGMGEDKTLTTDASKTISASVKYVNGPVAVALGYQSEGAGGSIAGSTYAVTATAAPALANTILAGSYDFGVAKVGFGLNRAEYKDVVLAGAVGTQAAGSAIGAQNEYNLSVAMPMGATTLSAGYAVSNGDTFGKSSGFGVQALYALSKRTTLYVGGVSTSTYDKLADSVKAAVAGLDIQRNTTYAAGVRHTF